jgi:hypothetical protein
MDYREPWRGGAKAINRRLFFAALAGLPFVGRLVSKAAPATSTRKAGYDELRRYLLPARSPFPPRREPSIALAVLAMSDRAIRLGFCDPSL